MRWLKWALILGLVSCSRSPDVAIVEFLKTGHDGIPCVELAIGEHVELFDLDLGFEGDVAAHKNLVSKISGKEIFGQKRFKGIQDISHLENLYRVSNLKIGSLRFQDRILVEHDDEFYKQTDLLATSCEREVGRIGWKLFDKQALLLDVPAGRMIVAEKRQALSRYLRGEFAVFPLEKKRGVLEFILDSSEGPLKCMIDSGATYSFFNGVVPKEQVLQDWLQSKECLIGVESILGKGWFHKIPIATFGVDAILGMDFLEGRQVVIDFVEEKIYLQKPNSLD